MSAEEKEILELYWDGMSYAQISEATGYSEYKLKKMLADYPVSMPPGYLWQRMFPSNQ